MTAKILYTTPSSTFWDAYVRLWENSLHPSVFQSPNLIKNLAAKFNNTLAIYQCCKDEDLIGLAFFRKEGNVYHFLTDVKADHNFFIIRKNCSSEEIEAFFEGFFQEIKKEKWTLLLNKKPAWAKYNTIFSKKACSSKLFFVNSKYAVCPVIEKETPEELFKVLTYSKEIGYQSRRLEKQQNAVFEVFTDGKDLDEWVEGFCRLHIERWKNTSTPSKYTDDEMRHILNGCMKAWAEDGALARFSIKVGHQRIAYNFGLVQGKSFIGQAQTYDETYRTYSPGKVLIHRIAQWMRNQDMNIFDFGDGDDIYKYTFATREQELTRIFISSTWNLPFMLKARVQQKIKEHPVLLRLLREKIKPFVYKVKNFNFQLIIPVFLQESMENGLCLFCF